MTPDANEKKEFVKKIQMKLSEKNEGFSDEDSDKDVEEEP